jgi:hypothetical protein
VTQPLSPADEVNHLNGVAVLSACDVWVAGFTEDSKLGERTLIEHWDGSAWTVIPSPHPGNISRLNSIRAFSPTSIWAVGEFTRAQLPDAADKNLILHYDGTRWTTVRSPSPGRNDQLYGVRWVSATDAWAVGRFTDAQDPDVADTALILHWNGTRWRQVTRPNLAGDSLFGVAATSRKDAWAVGSTFSGGQRPFILHWNGTAWKPAISPRLRADSGLNAVGVTGPASAWAVGITGAGERNGTPTGQTLALRWNGRTWAKVTTPAGPSGDFRVLSGVAAISPRNAWAVGLDNSRDTGEHAIILHWNGTRWAPVALPGASPDTETRLLAVAGSAGNVWAVGESSTGNDPVQALAFHGG